MRVLALIVVLLTPLSASAVSFVYDGGPIGTFPDGGALSFPKAQNASQPSIPNNKQFFSDDANAFWTDLLDVRSAITSGYYHGLTAQGSTPPAPIAPGVRIYAISDGGLWYVNDLGLIGPVTPPSLWRDAGANLITPSPQAGVYVGGTSAFDGGVTFYGGMVCDNNGATFNCGVTVTQPSDFTDLAEFDFGIQNSASVSANPHQITTDTQYTTGRAIFDAGICFHDATCQTTAASLNATTPYIAADGGLQWANPAGTHILEVAENLPNAYGQGPALQLTPDYSGERLALIDRTATVGNGYIQTEGNFRSNAALSFNARWPQGGFSCSAPSMDAAVPAFSLAFDFSNPSTGMLLCGRKTGAGNLYSLFSVDGDGNGTFPGTVTATGVNSPGQMLFTSAVAGGGATPFAMNVTANHTGFLWLLSNAGVTEALVTASGVVIGNGGLDANGNKVIGVANGTTSTDGVNVAQLSGVLSMAAFGPATTPAGVSLGAKTTLGAGTSKTIDIASYGWGCGGSPCSGWITYEVKDVTSAASICSQSVPACCTNVSSPACDTFYAQAPVTHCSGAYALSDILAVDETDGGACTTQGTAMINYAGR